MQSNALMINWESGAQKGRTICERCVKPHRFDNGRNVMFSSVVCRWCGHRFPHTERDLRRHMFVCSQGPKPVPWVETDMCRCLQCRCGHLPELRMTHQSSWREAFWPSYLRPVQPDVEESPAEGNQSQLEQSMKKSEEPNDGSVVDSLWDPGRSSWSAQVSDVTPLIDPRPGSPISLETAPVVFNDADNGLEEEDVDGVDPEIERMFDSL